MTSDATEGNLLTSRVISFRRPFRRRLPDPSRKVPLCFDRPFDTGGKDSPSLGLRTNWTKPGVSFNPYPKTL